MFNEFPQDPIITLGTSKEEADLNREVAETFGQEVKSTSVWEGPVPEHGSYQDISPFVRMSTPEFYFLRKANQLDESDAVLMGCELVSHFRSNITAHNMPEGVIERIDEPRTTVGKLRRYLLQVKDTPEGRKALDVLERVRREKDDYEDEITIGYVMSVLFG